MKIGDWFGKKAKKKGKKLGEEIPAEIRAALPKGVKIMRIEIGPRQIIKVVLYGMIVLWLLSMLRQVLLPETITRVPLSSIVEAVKQGEVTEITVMDDEIIAKPKNEDNKVLVSSKEPNSSMVEILQREGIEAGGVKLTVENRTGWKILGDIASLLLTVGLPILLIFWFFSRQTGGMGGGGLFGFGKSTARLFVKGKQNLSFKDVAGVEEAKKDLEEVVDFLKHPEKYRKMGARTPKGVLLVGPSGVGKTLLAKAVAGEANVPFYSMAGSEFMEMLVGVGASVVGETPVLVRDGEKTKLVPIKEVVDKYYQPGEEGGVKKVKDMETLGFDKARNGFWGTRSEKSEKLVFGNSKWKKVGAVYRHKADEVYEIEFLDGKIETTGDHSVFVRTQGWVVPKRVDELKKGDVLVNLPMNTRKWDEKLRRTIHIIKGHLFPKTEKLFLDVWQDDKEVWDKYQYAVSNPDNLYQYQLAVGAGVNQMTISNWQRGIHIPREVSKKMVKLDLPNRVEVTKELMWLLGVYTAEGRGTNNLEFTFGIDEKELVTKTAELMNKVFGIGKPKLQTTEDNSIKVIYYSAHLGRFFTTYCGNGCHNKHMPEFIWDFSRDYFVEFLRGYVDGDGYVYKEGKVTAVSVSHNLIRELAWLCSMHGIKTGIRFEVVKGGRIIKNKPLPESKMWKLIIGKSSNPFETRSKYLNQFKKCYVKKVTKKRCDGYVYDLCGIENEGFFGGEKPILLHNSRVRDLFATAKKAGKAIIFIDEIDAIGRARGGFDGGHGEREQTLNQILVEMDGFEANTTVIVLAATNRGDLLDPALLRPGRFDRRVVLEMPDLEARKEIIKIHAKGKPFAKGVDWEAVARRTVGFSGADIENMLNEAAIGAARLDKTEITMAEIEEAALKVKLGAEKKRSQTDEDKLMTAYHEAGHAIVNHVEGLDPVHRISIVSRGMALGFTLIPPKKDRVHETKTRLVKQMAMAMGGRAAEEMVFRDMTTGAAADITHATQMARNMVVEWGMSDLGPINLGPQVDVTDFGRAFFEPSRVSDIMQARVDEEIKKLVNTALARAKKILKENRAKLDKVAKVLVEKESLDEKEFEELMTAT